MIKIYHNPRCRKSREGLEYMEKSGMPFEKVLYLEDIPTKDELRQILKALGMKPIQLIRKNEAIWKEKFKGNTWTDEALIEAMTTFPKLIERPIIINGDKAVIGRPAAKIEELF